MKKLNKFIRTFVTKRGWSIVIFEGDNPFDFKQMKNFNKPTISKINITDCKAKGVADPFLVKNNNKYYLFFEIERIGKEGRGIIGLAISEDGINFKYDKIVLEEQYHLSYPKIYKIDQKFYMIPESGANKTIDIYEAEKFPYKWKKIKTILKGEFFADPTLIKYNGLWYLFVSTNKHNELNIYYANDFFGEYKAHKNNPIYNDNLSISRPAGMIFEYKNTLFRTAQDCSDGYGKRLNFLKINKLNENELNEELIYTITPSCGIKWNSTHVHHYSFINDNGKYLMAMDGAGFMYRLNKYIRKKD